MSPQSFVDELKSSSQDHEKFAFAWVSTSNLISLSQKHDYSISDAQQLCLSNKILPRRYIKNFPTIDLKQQLALASSKVLLVGLGGLGGYILEILGRTGVGSFFLADGDVFEESNFNRQLLGYDSKSGVSKAEAAAERLTRINPLCTFEIVNKFLIKEDLPGLVPKVDIVIDALGGIEFRPDLLEATGNAGLPLVTGFVAGSTGLAATVLPGGKSPAAFWQGSNDQGAEIKLGNIACTVVTIATIQAQEALNLLTGKPARLIDKVILTDLDSLTFEQLEL
ncbi:HesA/MoeB/ThiF family protein [Desulfonatronovibrio magnus]|uniref:HesA/MoeB/ThiF family protein n=1 Tax=Desulfonatronovibrio magnus TaxID=698827 RepID=UPI000697EBF5|nr:ThiF family adenylyltransferase [Desulfonatronovibrio magnus]